MYYNKLQPENVINIYAVVPLVKLIAKIYKVRRMFKKTFIFTVF